MKKSKYDHNGGGDIERDVAVTDVSISLHISWSVGRLRTYKI